MKFLQFSLTKQINFEYNQLDKSIIKNDLASRATTIAVMRQGAKAVFAAHLGGKGPSFFYFFLHSSAIKADQQLGGSI